MTTTETPAQRNERHRLKRMEVLAKIVDETPRAGSRYVASWLKAKIEQAGHRTAEDRVLMILASDYLYRKDMR